jgi:hypothetical protein
MSNIERRYGIAGKAAGEAALAHGRDGVRIRSCQDAFVLSRIARAVVDALDADDRGAVAALEEIAQRGGLDRTRSGRPLEGMDCARIARSAIDRIEEQ